MENKGNKIKAAELNDEMLDKVSGGESEAFDTNKEEEYEELLKPTQIER